jgi:hypothetical protein
MDDVKRRAFLRLMLGATTNDVRVQLGALRDLGALPMDTDLEAVIDDLGLEGPPIDPTQLTPEEMIQEIQRIVKLLLGYGARMPKELMLYVKNLVFLDGAIARLAPDLDLFAEIANITVHFVQTHGERLFADIGIDASAIEPMVALPFSPGNTVPVSEAAARDIRIDQVFIGSCTNARIEDLREAAAIMRGRKVAKWVRCIVIPATQDIYMQALREGLVEAFTEAGCAVSAATCGPCLGGYMGVLAEGERCVSTSNRNFPGRMGLVKL